MNIRQLEAFRAVMISGSTVGAAKLLRMSQPGVSRLLGQLEASLALTLFDRSTGRLLPTVEANLLHSEVERTFTSVERIRELARDIQAAGMGELSIATLPMLALGFLPDAVAEFNLTHPRTRISLNVRLSPHVAEMVAAQQVDFGFAEYPYEASDFGRPGVEVDEFCAARLVLAVPEGHRLAGAALARPEDIEGERYISLNRSTVTRLVVDRLFERARVERQMILDSQISAVVASFVARGLGVGLVDPFTAADFAGRGVVAVPFEPAIAMRIGLLQPTHKARTRIASEFVSLLRRRKRELLAESV